MSCIRRPCTHCGKELPDVAVACEKCETALFCNAECRTAGGPAHMATAECEEDARAWAEFNEATSLTRWKSDPIPGPEDGIEVAVIPADKVLSDPKSGLAVHTERISRENAEKLLAHPSALLCPLAAALGFPVVVAPAAGQARLTSSKLFSCTAEDANTLATRLTVSARTGFAPGAVCGKVVVLRADLVGFKAEPECARLHEKLSVLLARVFQGAGVEREPETGLPSLAAVAREAEEVRPMLREAVEMCGMEWRGWDVSAETALAAPCPRPCSCCGAPGAQRACGACHSRFYCSAECQKKDWPEHKEDCKLHMAPTFAKKD